MAKIRFAAIGFNHGHIYGQVDLLRRSGAELVSFYAIEPELIEKFQKMYPDAKRARSENEILEDRSIQLVTSASIFSERAPLGVRVMKHGKDFFVDKPGFTTLEQLAEVRKVQAETKRKYSVFYGRLENRATIKAGELVKAGAIGKIVQTLGLGPHKASLETRPPWFFKKAQYGGILCDVASHLTEQFLYFTRSTEAEIVSAQVGNFNHPQHAEMDDFGDCLLRSPSATGYIRVDWLSPGGLNTWGDGRLVILGTEGYIEIRKNCDIAGRFGGNHLFLVDQKKVEYMDCRDVELPFGAALVKDLEERTETAMTQAHTFLASELALKAQAQAKRIAG
ncbi:MAG TPA: Gfo/Idh/MocA family oxidoreductase [Planctomycetota bacterium]|nr:Gfo/Idh/MocA family oxidoreductase [Planctomycetota bacterium]